MISRIGVPLGIPARVRHTQQMRLSRNRFDGDLSSGTLTAALTGRPALRKVLTQALRAVKGGISTQCHMATCQLSVDYGPECGFVILRARATEQFNSSEHNWRYLRRVVLPTRLTSHEAESDKGSAPIHLDRSSFTHHKRWATNPKQSDKLHAGSFPVSLKFQVFPGFSDKIRGC